MTTDDGVATGELRRSIYAVDPLNSTTAATANENVRLSGTGNGWFVTTKYDGSKDENQHGPQGTPGATMQNIRLYYRDWDGRSVVAEHVQDEAGRSMFALAIIDKDYVGVCSLPATGGAITTCLTDTIRYVEPDGTKATAQLVSQTSAIRRRRHSRPHGRRCAGYIVRQQKPDPFFPTATFAYRWTVPGATLHGATVITPITHAGTVQVRLDVTKTLFGGFPSTNTFLYPVLVAQNTRVGVNIWPQGPAPHGSSPQVWADIDPVKTEGVQCTWNQSTGAIGCVSPTGAVQFSVDGQPVGDPVSVVPTRIAVPPCPLPICVWRRSRVRTGRRDAGVERGSGHAAHGDRHLLRRRQVRGVDGLTDAGRRRRHTGRDADLRHHLPQFDRTRRSPRPYGPSRAWQVCRPVR